MAHGIGASDGSCSRRFEAFCEPTVKKYGIAPLLGKDDGGDAKREYIPICACTTSSSDKTVITTLAAGFDEAQKRRWI
jgi:hypothetical protein